MKTGYAFKNCNVIYGDAKRDVEKMMTILIDEDGLILEIGKVSDLAIMKLLLSRQGQRYHVLTKPKG
ncbi:hypothetical protein [Paenibacillus sp. 23TSA30-6]|uniref:hypothetical protein n=1 Tax=Paenibacillus sp. 23TSA30-6 TaxID=2546104 RepID=UPI001EE2D7A3|nr:hypothetical protein [Paenibacillus sp. 23TSA30-6]